MAQVLMAVTKLVVINDYGSALDFRKDHSMAVFK